MNIRGIDDVLAEFELCRDLPADVRAELVGCGRFRVFRAGDLLLGEGAPADQMFLIRSGSVAIEIDPPGRGPLTIETLGPGDPVGISWILPPYRSVFDARARTETRTVQLDAACMRGHFDDDPELGYQVVRRFAGAIGNRLQAARLQLIDIYGDTR